MRKNDYFSMGILMLVPFLIFYPLFTAEYLYTDEAVQLRLYNLEDNFQMFTSQGRYITEKIFQWLFHTISSTREVTYLRLFSFFGWILSIPVWYFILKEINRKEDLPKQLSFFSVLYMIAMPPFTIYVSWASCMELFLANTCGLLSGYFLYSGICSGNKAIGISTKAVLLSILFGFISLSTYQTGFGCFILPFVLHLLSKKKVTRSFWIGVGGCFFIYLLYFALFKLSVVAGFIGHNERTSLYLNPVRKLVFMLTRPLSGSFHFTLIFNERSKLGFFIYVVLILAWLVLQLWLMRSKPLNQKLGFLAALFFLLLCIYIPGLVVKENYASNRTLFALNMAVFFSVFAQVFHFIQTFKWRLRMVSILSLLFIINAWYNFNILFLSPIAKEYRQVRTYFENNYTPYIHTVHFIRPKEDFFVQRFGITRSWDEFGVPSTFFDWTPESWVKQVLFEKTGDRQLAERLEVKHWLGREAYQQSHEQTADGVLLVDVEAILNL